MIGCYTNKVNFQRPNSVRDALGGFTNSGTDDTFTTFHTDIAGSIQRFQGQGNRNISDEREQVVVSHLFYTPYKSISSDLPVPGDRLVYGSEIYEIKYVDDLARKNEVFRIELERIL